MLASEVFDFSFWWICPLVMIILCFFMVRGRKSLMMCGFGSRDRKRYLTEPSDSAIEILEKRYAQGDINREEYEERKRILSQNN